MRVELAPGRANEEREPVQHVDRPIGEDRPRPEGDAGFPGEDERRDACPLRGGPVREPVSQEEERGEEGEPGECATPWPRRHGGRSVCGRTHSATRCASDTVKIPDSPMC